MKPVPFSFGYDQISFGLSFYFYMMRCLTVYHFYNLKKWKAPMQEFPSSKVADFTESNTHPWVFSKFFFRFLVPNRAKHLIYDNKTRACLCNILSLNK